MVFLPYVTEYLVITMYLVLLRLLLTWTKNVEFCFCIFDKFSDDIQLKMNMIPGKQMNYMT